MDRPVIWISSITYAMQGRDLLRSRGFRCSIEKVHSETGCGYGIYVPERTDEAEFILRERGFRVFGRLERRGRR